MENKQAYHLKYKDDADRQLNNKENKPRKMKQSESFETAGVNNKFQTSTTSYKKQQWKSSAINIVRKTQPPRLSQETI